MSDDFAYLEKMDYIKVDGAISSCIKNYLERSNASGYVIGLSGGLDSTVTLYMLVRSVGREKVFGLIMPEIESNLEDINDAIYIAEKLGIKYSVLDITNVVRSALDLFGESYETADKKAKGNLKARARMMILYYFANKNNYLVAATSDKSEYLLGYFTKWGDGAGDIYPIANLYKTQVRQLALYLGVPEKISYKPSSPGLWPGQKATDELKYDYSILDKIIFLLVEKQETVENVSKMLNIEKSDVENIWNTILKNSHKRIPLNSCTVSGVRE
ncbi:NAD+ synthase [Fervidicoccus fontis]|uniref:NH(3)-dependent NAD(+) synthetase n=2 Tax=Fervidicoccus fontis TaxID=683846 RepID=A0A2J6NAR9_9CREN|nr:NAD+ synthase [Fervidicoccus fontis]PMB75572.1 MAG: NAD(+) synthetase [Fervidicoccus fontis]PMB78420.1 MAG: NAD(+) synthetase [Fervidicoccus fontis]HEW64349.1 NAD+ synthase [Fervidicoccus fontis]